MGYKKYNKIFQYTKDGRLIKVWNGRKELLTSSFRMKSIYDCINGVNKSGDPAKRNKIQRDLVHDIKSVTTDIRTQTIGWK